VARVTVEDCLEKINNRFALVILAAERARQLAKGAAALVECDNKPAVTALREIAAGQVRVDLTDFDENESLRGFAGPVSREDLPPAADDDFGDLPPEADDLPLAADDLPAEAD